MVLYYDMFKLWFSVKYFCSVWELFSSIYMCFVCVKEILKVKVGSIEIEVDVLEVCIVLYVVGFLKVVVLFL